MKKLITFSCLLLIIGCSLSNDREISDVNIHTLLCENKVNPINIENIQPRLSWKMNSKIKGQFQTAYRVLVATSVELLKENKADLWDSGKVDSSASVLVPYNGKELKSGERYYFTVKIWDKNGVQSDYAQPAFWEMAILNNNEWKAKWISAPRVFDYESRTKTIIRSEKDGIIPTDPMPLFRKSITIENDIKSAKIYLSGLGFFELYLNGVKISDHIFSPAFTDYSKTVFYEKFDLTPGLINGENVLGVMLGNGWYNHVSCDAWSFSRAPWIADPAVICQMEIEFKDGSKKQVISDETWKCAPGPILFSSIRIGETYDATKEIEKWSEPGINEETWQNVRLVRGPEGKLKAQNIPPVRIMNEITPQHITKIGQGAYIVDFGQNMAGFVKIKATANQGTKVRFRYAERLTAEGKLDQSSIASCISDLRFQTDEYIFKGIGVEEWNPRFSYHGFRYLEVSGWEGPLTEENLKACLIHNDFITSSSFECSLPLINRIQKNTVWSYKSNFVNIPTDCPQREKNGWTGDAQLACETGLFNFDLLTSYEKWANDILDAQRADGMLPCVIPSGGWGFYSGNGPAWDCALFQIPWNLYLYEGDRKIISDVYPAIKKYLELLSAKADSGIVKWGLGDWCPARTKTPRFITSTAYYFQDLLIASKMAALLGFTEDQSFYINKASEIKNTFNKEFFDQDGEYKYPTQTGLACALYMQIADSSKNDQLINQLVKNISANDYNLDFGILGAKYVPNVLSRTGHSDLAFNMINTTKYPGWGNCIKQGATTLWEDWNGSGSRNHIMYGDVSAWFYKNLAGILPDIDQPGFKHFIIEPYFPPELDWVKTIKNTGYGNIKVDWSKTGDTIRLNLEIPVNTTASVILPSGNLLVDSEQPVEGENGIIVVGNKGNRNDLRLASGVYNLTLICNDNNLR